MAGINISGTGQEDKKYQAKYPTTSTGAQGSTVTGTNVFGSAIPNKVGALAATKEPPKTPTGGTDDTGGTGGNTGAGSNISAGTNTGAVNVSSNKVNLDSLKNQIGKTEQQEIVSAEKRAETNIADLKNAYAQRLRDDYDYSTNMLRQERDNALRENWILQQQAEAALPEQMAAAGINGGASETTLADLRARYEGNRNDIRGNYMDEASKLSQQNAAAQADAQQGYNEKWLEYLLSLAKAEEQQLRGY
jgi:hypothetical protein